VGAIKTSQAVTLHNFFQFVVTATALNSTWHTTDSPHNHHKKNTVFQITIICATEPVGLYTFCTTLCIVPMGLIGTLPWLCCDLAGFITTYFIQEARSVITYM
jgi:hypothetical protein